MTAPPNVHGAFDALVQSYYRSWFRFHPEAAVDAGVPGYAHLLTSCGDEEKGALVCLNDELRVALEDIDAAALDPDRRVDYEILTGAAQLENQYLLDVESLHPDPNRWLPVNAIYQLTIRRVEDFDAAMEARLAAIPAHLSAAQLRLSSRARHVPLLWVRSASTAARAGAEFVRGLVAHPKISASPKRAALLAQGERAAAALGRYADFLDSVVAPEARGAFACGAEYFGHLLRHRHFLDVDAEQLHGFGERLIARTRAQLEAACTEVFGHADVARAVSTIQSQHPQRAELLSVYANTIRAAREFVRERKLVSLPDTERLEVVETPAFLRHQIPFAAYCEPAPNDPEQLGYYYVTPPLDAAQLAEHDAVGLTHTCVHEAYPGHHLHFVRVNASAAARTPPRLMNPSATSYEGWALYCEQLMQEQGFLARPESRILLLRDRLWRALRICIDVELHTRELTLEAAADRLITVLGFPRDQAIADVTWYTQSPTVPLGYATGWALINALRTRVAPGSLQGFHDQLLAPGAVALPLGIARGFGKETWESVKSDVFGS
jgi:uncharacterized protein (DUF885 family)